MYASSSGKWSVCMIHNHWSFNTYVSLDIRSGTDRTAMTTWTGQSQPLCSAYVHADSCQLWSIGCAMPCLVLGVCASQGCTKCTGNDLMLWVPGGMAGLLEAVQKMVAGKANREEVQGLRRLLGDKVNLVDHQVHHQHCLDKLC